MRTVRMIAGRGGPHSEWKLPATRIVASCRQADLPPASKHLNPISLFAVIVRPLVMAIVSFRI
jgi:hypothetical protein